MERKEKSDQKQNVSKDSTAFQAGGDITIINQGLSIEDVRTISMEVFELNFHKLTEVARNTALKRATEITEKFLQRLYQENPVGMVEANNPDFQYALFTMQKEYAKNGDEDLGELLVDLLINRSKHPQRDIIQIVLNESLNTAPKLTKNQISALSIIFLYKNTIQRNIGSLNALGAYFDKYTQKLLPSLSKNESCYQHLMYSGCGTISSFKNSLEDILKKNYQGIFQKGFEKNIIEQKEISIEYIPYYFMNCMNNPLKAQVRFITKEELRKSFQEKEISTEDQKKIESLFDKGSMDRNEIRALCIKLRPYVTTLFEIWSDSSMGSFTLSSVGITIGHANLKNFDRDFTDLSTWIN